MQISHKGRWNHCASADKGKNCYFITQDAVFAISPQMIHSPKPMTIIVYYTSRIFLT